MHVLLVSQEYPPETAHGGIATQAHAKAVGLATRGHRVTVLSASVTGERSVTSAGGVTVIRIPGGEARLPYLTEAARWVTWSVEVAAEIARITDGDRIDVVDVPEYGGEGYVHLLARGAPAVPTVVHLQGPLVMLARTIGWPELDSELFRTGTLMEATSIRLADAVMSSSAESRKWCAREYGLGLRDVPVIHMGVDVNRFRPMARTSDRPTIAFVGRVTPSKGVFDLVDAAIRIADQVKGLRIVLIGRSENGAAEGARKLAVDAGHDDLVDVVGPVPHGDLPQLLADADVFAAPSHQEGGPGFVYLEAMACGLPVVGCSGSGATEVVHHGVTGLLVPPRDVDSLAAALLTMFENDERRARMGAAARALVETQFDAALCIDELEGFYEAVRR